MQFSDRIGVTKPKSIIQIDEIDKDLKNTLWNCLCVVYFDTNYSNSVESPGNAGDRLLSNLYNRIFTRYFKIIVDDIPKYYSGCKTQIKKYFFETDWFNIYNLVEFIINNYENEMLNEKFINVCNNKLEIELSGYRIINKQITPITNIQEIESIENAFSFSYKYKGVQEHLKTALELFSNKTSPDYRNSIKESISAVESLCSILTEEPKLTLAQSIKKIEDKGIYLNQALRNGLSSIYGYTSSSDGIRHGLQDESSLNQEDAKFMLVICSAFTNYLIEKYERNQNPPI